MHVGFSPTRQDGRRRGGGYTEEGVAGWVRDNYAAAAAAAGGCRLYFCPFWSVVAVVVVVFCRVFSSRSCARRRVRLAAFRAGRSNFCAFSSLLGCCFVVFSLPTHAASVVAGLACLLCSVVPTKMCGNINRWLDLFLLTCSPHQNALQNQSLKRKRA